MAFTPTSVIRKRVNDKVEERQKQGEAGPSNQPYPAGLNKQASPQPLRPIVKSKQLPTAGCSGFALEITTIVAGGLS